MNIVEINSGLFCREATWSFDHILCILYNLCSCILGRKNGVYNGKSNGWKSEEKSGVHAESESAYSKCSHPLLKSIEQGSFTIEY